MGGGSQVLALLAGVLTPGLFVSPTRLLAQSRLDLCKSSDQSGLVTQQSREILHQQVEQGLQHERRARTRPQPQRAMKAGQDAPMGPSQPEHMANIALKLPLTNSQRVQVYHI